MSRVLIFPVTAMYDCHASVKTQQKEAKKKKCKNAVVVVQMFCRQRKKRIVVKAQREEEKLHSISLASFKPEIDTT